MPMRILGMVALALVGCGRGAEANPTAPAASDACRSRDVERELATQPAAGVILMLNEGDVPAREARVLGDLGSEFQLERRYASIPGMAGKITRAGYARAQKHADVRCVQFDGPGGGA